MQEVNCWPWHSAVTWIWNCPGFEFGANPWADDLEVAAGPESGTRKVALAPQLDADGLFNLDDGHLATRISDVIEATLLTIRRYGILGPNVRANVGCGSADIMGVLG